MQAPSPDGLGHSAGIPDAVKLEKDPDAQEILATARRYAALMGGHFVIDENKATAWLHRKSLRGLK